MWKQVGERCGKPCISGILGSKRGITPSKINGNLRHSNMIIKRKSQTLFQLNISKHVGENSYTNLGLCNNVLLVLGVNFLCCMPHGRDMPTGGLSLFRTPIHIPSRTYIMLSFLRPIYFRSLSWFPGICTSNIQRYFLDFTFLWPLSWNWQKSSNLLISHKILLQVLLAVFRNPKMRTVTNYFVANLAITDFLYVAWTPFIATTRITQEWVFGEGICKLVTYMQFVSGVCSILTMMLISIERYLCVCATPGKKMSHFKCALLIACTWILSLAFPVPVAVAQAEKSIEIKYVPRVYCGMNWSEEFHVDVYLTCMVILFFVMPLVIISMNYIRIFRVVNKSAKATSSIASSTRELKRERQVRLTKMFIAIVCLFVVMWLPFFVLSFLAVYFKKITSTQFTVTIILSSANTCQNPILYGYFNTKFRKEFKRICRCCWRREFDLDSTYTYTVRTTGSRDVTVSSW